MRTAIVAMAVVLGVAGCESNAQPGAAGMLGYQVDAARERSVWLTREGVQIHSSTARPVRIDLPGWIYAGAPYCPPGLAIGPKGEVVVTSNVIATLWRVDPESQAVTIHPLALGAEQGRDVGFAALLYSPEQRAYVAYSDTQRSVWKIDAALTTAAKVGEADFRRPARGRGAPCAELARRLSQPGIQ